MIVNFSASTIPSQEANSLQVIKTSDALVNQGEEIILFSRLSKSHDSIKTFYNLQHDIEVYQTRWIKIPIVGGVFYGILNSYKLRKILGKCNTTVKIYGRDIYSIMFALLLSYKMVLVYESHMIPTNRMKFLMESLLFKSSSFTALVTTSESLRTAYLKLFSLDESKTHLVNNGADQKEEIRLQFDCEPKKNKKLSVLYVGSLKKGKGVDFVIQLARKLQDIDFVVIGGSVNEIELIKTSLKVPSNVNFLGFLKQCEINTVYRESEICLAPYQDDNIKFKGVMVPRYPSPLKIIEYMSHGKAIVASDLAMNRELLKNNFNALLCSPCDVDEWAAGIKKLDDNRDLLKSISRQALLDFGNKLSWDCRAKKITKIFDNSVGHSDFRRG